MANREHPDHASAPVEGIDYPIASHPELPQPLEIPPERLARRRMGGNGAKGPLDPALDLGREVANDLGHVRWEVDPPGGHYRDGRFGGISRSPNTSSNDRPRRLAA
jgi:hypothetical protein